MAIRSLFRAARGGATSLALGAALLAAALFAGMGAKAQEEGAASEVVLPRPATVAIAQFIEHPSLDAAREGVINALEEGGYTVGENLTLVTESAQGNAVTAGQIADKFVGDAPDVIVALATPMAQAVAGATDDIPIIFSAITAPAAARLVEDLARPGGNATGTSDLSPVPAQLLLFKRLIAFERLGIVYNPGEANSAALVEKVKEYEEPHGFEVVEAAAINTAQVLAAARSLVGRADLIYVPTDNTVVAALEGVIKVGQDAQIPVVAGDTDSVQRGAIAALGFNYYDLGRQTGRMVLRVLAGEDPATMMVESAEDLHLFVNPGSAESMGLTIPEDVMAEAHRIVSEDGALLPGPAAGEIAEENAEEREELAEEAIEELLGDGTGGPEAPAPDAEAQEEATPLSDDVPAEAR